MPDATISRTVAAGILPAVEPGFQPGGRSSDTRHARKTILPSLTVNGSFRAARMHALYVRQ